MARKHSRRTARGLYRCSAVGIVAGLAGCQKADACEGLRSFDPPPEPDPSEAAPATVMSGEWIGAGVLEISFSRPLQAGNSPDPSRFAVIGWAAQVEPYDAYAGPDVCYVRTQYNAIGVGGYYYQASGVADVWIAPEDPTLLRLRMSNVAATCRTIPGTLGDGVMLVYQNTENEGIGNLLLDAEGNPVPDLGPAWAIQQLDGSCQYYYCSLNQTFTDHLPYLSELPDIPCP